MKQLRDYQKRDLKLILESISIHQDTLYQLPTGGGKTLVLSKVIEHNKTQNILILAHKRRLITQISQHLQSLNIEVGLLMGEVSENIDCNILTSTINTASKDKRIDFLLQRKWDMIIIDEAHRTRTPSYEKLIENLTLQNKDIKIFGVTATPYRVDKKGLDKYYQNLICSDEVQTLIDNGYLSNYQIFYTPIGEIDTEVSKTESDYVVQALSVYMRQQKYLSYLVECYKKRGLEKQTLIFCVDKLHARSVIETYRDSGYTKIAYIDSDTKEEEREDIFTKYENKEIQFIVSIETMTEGVDLPETGCIQLARPTKSLVLYLQMVGRGLRPKSDNSNLIILDCSGVTQEHGTPSSKRHWDLNSNLHPNNLRTKNRVVGKREDGSFTEEIEDMEFCELIEMTPEEYLLKVSGGLEEAEKANKKDDILIVEKMVNLLTLILEKIKLKDSFKVFFNKDSSLYKQTIILKTEENNPSYLLDYSIKEFTSYSILQFLIQDQRWNSKLSTEEKYNNFLSFQVLAGKIAEFCQKKENSSLISSVVEECKSIERGKINLHPLREKIRKIEEDNFQKKIEELISNTSEILFNSGGFQYSSYFRDVYYSRYSTTKIVFSKNKLLSTNEVIFYSGESELYRSKFMEKKKVLEMLRSEKHLIVFDREIILQES